MYRHLLTALALLPALGLPPAATAADDHGHDHGASATPSGPALPRFAAVSEAFELVGVLSGQQLLLYLDRAPDNSPVTDARIELDIAGTTVLARKHGVDAFEVVLAAAPPPGVLPITATVTVGSETDLLAGELDLHAEAPAAALQRPAWRRYALWGGGVVAALVALMAPILMTRRSAARRAAHTGASA